MKLPARGTPLVELRAKMAERKQQDADWRGGRTWSLIYPAGEAVDEVLRAANELYVFENALNPFRFPSLRQMEGEVVEMTLGLLSAPENAGGTMTSGGTESILMAVKTARERARVERGVTAPEMIVPRSAHPAFAKAAHYLGLELKQAPLASDLRVDVAAVRELVTQNTALIVGSAPNYPHGMIDPIPDLAAIAAERGISFHTDACVGGFLLPFLERLGEPIPAFDFRVEGVTTISADVHKYGYATKGASVISHRDRSTLTHQIFLYDQWPGGLYGSPALAGARPAAPIAAAWAVMNFLGEEGYVALARRVRDTVRVLRTGIESIPELHLWGNPPASLLAFGSEKVDILAVGDVMDDRGWHLDRQTGPDALHMMVSPEHDRIADAFLADLREAVAHHGPRRGGAARYS
ncbi:MAG: aspartate aminotransferase family protein [Deltaproteobacteria bacterium]|nr:aspartate aminotransferase family protein [Deltaproteobacteria bacterium]